MLMSVSRGIVFEQHTVCPEGSVGAEDEERESLFFFFLSFFLSFFTTHPPPAKTGNRLFLFLPSSSSSSLEHNSNTSGLILPSFFSVVSWSDGVVRGGSGGHGRAGEGSLALRSRRQQTQGQPSQPSPVSQPPFSFYRRRKTFFIPVVPLGALSSSSAPPPSFKIFHGLRACTTTFDPLC